MAGCFVALLREGTAYHSTADERVMPHTSSDACPRCIGVSCNRFEELSASYAYHALVVICFMNGCYLCQKQTANHCSSATMCRKIAHIFFSEVHEQTYVCFCAYATIFIPIDNWGDATENRHCKTEKPWEISSRFVGRGECFAIYFNR